MKYILILLLSLSTLFATAQKVVTIKVGNHMDTTLLHKADSINTANISANATAITTHLSLINSLIADTATIQPRLNNILNVANSKLAITDTLNKWLSLGMYPLLLKYGDSSLMLANYHTGIVNNIASILALNADSATLPKRFGDIYTALGTKENTANKDQINGYAGIDPSGHILVSELPSSVVGGLNYQGSWNAVTNIPSLASGVGSKGFYYVVSVAGTITIDGITGWNQKDWIVYNGTQWQKVDNTQFITSVNGFTGDVTLTTDNIQEATIPTNKYYTEARVSANINVTANTAARHNAVTIGTANGLSIAGQALSLGLSGTSSTGALSSTDWNTFNGKLPLSGGTLSGSLTAPSLQVNGTGNFTGALNLSANLFFTNTNVNISRQPSIDAMEIGGANGYIARFNNSGATTLSGSLTGTNLTFSSLSGTGTRMMVADSVGNVKTQAIPSTTITGTANQVIASASTGAVTLSLPQNIATTSSPTFAGATMSSLTGTGVRIVTADAGGNLTATTSLGAVGWSLLGNAGTTSSNFIGTTDNQPIYIKMKNGATEPSSYTTFSTTTGFMNLGMGYNAIATGGNSTAFGEWVTSSGYDAFSAGYTNTASGQSSIALGRQLTAKAVGGVAVGYANDATDAPTSTTNALDRLFQIGNGISGSNHNAMTVLANGNVGIGVLAPSTALEVNGIIKLSVLNTAPASATATGTLGEIRYTSTYIYVCTATNTWVRSALTTW